MAGCVCQVVMWWWSMGACCYVLSFHRGSSCCSEVSLWVLECERSGGDLRSEKPKLDGFSLKNGDEVIFKMDVAAGRGRGAERAVREFEVMGWVGRISFSFVGGWTTSWNDVGRVAGLNRIISSHLISSSLAPWQTNQSNSSNDQRAQACPILSVFIGGCVSQ